MNRDNRSRFAWGRGVRLARPLARVAVIAAMAATLVAGFGVASASADPSAVPRFVSLRTAHANARVGPGTGYAVLWEYRRKGLPLEVLNEYGNWRRIRDAAGDVSWVHRALLSSRRAASVAIWIKKPIALRSAPEPDARVRARLTPGVVLSGLMCEGRWCRGTAAAGDRTGYVPQAKLWGVYPGERFG